MIVFDVTVNRHKSYHSITSTPAVVFKIIMIIISRHRTAAMTLSKSSRAAKSVGGDRGVWNSRFPYLLLPLPAPFRRGSRLFVLFLLWNVAQDCEIFLLFSRFSSLWESRFPASLLPPPVPLPPPILPGSRSPVPLHKSPTWASQTCGHGISAWHMRTDTTVQTVFSRVFFKTRWKQNPFSLSGLLPTTSSRL